MNTRLRLAIVLTAAVLLVACKIEIQVPRFGKVASESGAFDCEAEQTCEIDVVDQFFDETFSGEPGEGYRFVEWATFPGTFCGGASAPCRLTTAAFADHPHLLPFLDTDELFYLRPVFERQDLPAVAGLVFRSGFDSGTVHSRVTGTAQPCTDDLAGEDLLVSDAGDWENDLENPDGPFGQFHFCFGGGTPAQRAIDLVEDPDDALNQVLRGRIVEPNEVVRDDQVACNNDALGARKARIQALLKDNHNLPQFNYRLRMRLGEAFEAIVAEGQAINWMTIGEFWNNLPAEQNTFRVTLNLVKDAVQNGPLYFGLKAEKKNDGEPKWIRVWPEGDTATDVLVPIGEWFTLEVSVIEGDESSGRVVVRMTTAEGKTHTVADVTDWTYSPDGIPDGFKDLNPIKLYTSGALMCELKSRGLPLEVWWDDFAIGTGE